MIDEKRSLFDLPQAEVEEAIQLVPPPTLPDGYVNLSDITDKISLRTNLSLPSNLAPFYPQLKLLDDGEISVVYTETIEKGRADRRTVGKFNKFCGRFFYAPDYAAKSILHLAHGLFPNLDRVIKLAVTANDIRRVYVGGPRSCMDRRMALGELHPCMVYAYPYDRTEVVPGSGNDLVVAYLGDIDSAKARCVVNTKDKTHSVIYAGNPAIFGSILKNTGWCSSGRVTAGQRLAKIEVNGGRLLPYLDDRLPVVDCDGHLLVGTSTHDYGVRSSSSGVF
jgi:hypothetical protein